MHLGIDLDHLVIQLGVVFVHDMGSPTRGNEGGLDTTRQRSREDVGDLETDQECESDDKRRVLPLVVVCGLGEVQVQVGKKGAGVSDEEGTEREDRSNQAVLRRSVGFIQQKQGRLH